MSTLNPIPPCGVGLTLLERREIEARIVGPLLRAFAEAMGEEATRTIALKVIDQLARRAGAELSESLGRDSLPSFTDALQQWTQGDALEIDVLRADENRLEFNVTRCRYAEMYRSLGLADLGSILSCQRDFATIQGFNPDISLERTQTIMEGARHCDFRFRNPRGEKAPSFKSNSQDDDPVE